ncbi:hypothetical protein [Nostoc sp. TCL26-01]|uniref:hypothetical protein n=1 Tax=Nostoc sp. TCL26-01 TaxID=2576904 RepID=UPI0015BA87B7|nr:hypothetical protein [Nostoc sp. TCL26-01]QLE56310.1 hypothetical protein FD725_12620 [Nostoc sp. TCL26-01]
MTLPSCASCAVTLNQQQEQNISHQNQCQGVPVQHSQHVGKTCTVVENGKVVVKAVQSPES